MSMRSSLLTTSSFYIFISFSFLSIIEYSFARIVMDPKIREYQASSIPLKRFSEPHEQAAPAVMLLSDKVSVDIFNALLIMLILLSRSEPLLNNSFSRSFLLFFSIPAGFLHHWNHPSSRWRFHRLLIFFERVDRPSRIVSFEKVIFREEG